MRNRKHIRTNAKLRELPSHAANLIARNLIVRALREHGLHHVLQGKPAFVGFVGARADTLEVLTEEANAFLRSVTGLDAAYEVLCWRKDYARKPPMRADSFRSLSNNSVVFGFAQDHEDIPAFFQGVADQIVMLGRIDENVLAMTFKSFFGSVPSPQVLSAAVDIPVDILNVYLRKGRTLRQAIDGIERYASVSGAPAKPDTTPHPRLEDLSGLADAVQWGFSLATDLRDYREGRIPWADVDRGALLSGPSGTGKTLFAKALANTCGVPVHIASLARWQAKGHLGNLLKAMAESFDQALKSAPSILFIDEFDAIGSRNQFKGEHEQYCREVVDALLERLDGAQGRDGVVVVAATNHPDKIDPNLMRPGRLDRHFRITLPDLSARTDIFRYHLGSNLVGVDLTDVARNLEGATGAEIEQIVRDARRRARGARRTVILEDLDRSIPRTRISEQAFRRACIHEAGHTLVGYLLSSESGSIPTAVRVLRETIPTQSDVGQTSFHRVPGLARCNTSYLAEITTLLAGLAAEDVALGNHGDGSGGEANSDIHLATITAARMEASLGLGGSLVYLAPSNGEEILAQVRCDSHLRRQVHARLKACAHRARTLVVQNREQLELLATALARRNQLEQSDIRTLFHGTRSDNVSSNCEKRDKDAITKLSGE